MGVEDHGVVATDVPRLSLGTMTFGGQVDAVEAAAIVDMALNAGVRLIDTANVYQRGGSEEMLGRLLVGRRDDVVLASKVGSPTGQGVPELRPDRMREELIGSLRRLGTDRLDLYYLHRPDRSTPIEETLGAMQGFIDEGLVLAAAASNYAAWHLATMRSITDRNDWAPVRVAQPMYNLLARRAEDEYFEGTTVLGIVNIIYNPLAGGLLSGKYRAEERPVGTMRFGEERYGRMYRERYWNDVQFAAVAAAQAIADEAGLTLVELAFRWLLSRPEVGSILIGISSLDQLRVNLAACAGGPLDADVLAACDEIRPLSHGVAPVHVK
jgi:aryl-alcohol dehydrogenase-like predicted oxidoreductase